MSRRALTNRTDRAARHYQHGYGRRVVNDWGGGDLPAPYAEGDVVRIPVDAPAFTDGRIPHGWSPNPEQCGPGLYRVVQAFSIGEGDEWYFRVCPIRDGEMLDNVSDRLHVIPPDVDFTAGWELVESADSEGLEQRERMLAGGWTPSVPVTCPACGQRVYGESEDD